jgi:DNA-binding NarL/FixJ family response regulator
MNPAPPIRVLCVDDHRIVREGIALILSREPDLSVVAMAASVEEAVAEYNRHLPDVTLMDLRLKTSNGIEAVREIRREHPEARIVVLTMYRGDEDIHRALSAGAVTYLLKDALSDDLIRTIREVHAGGHPIGPDVKARLEERAAHRPLTPREIEVLQLVSQGKRNKEIAALLGLSEDTVPVHLKNVFAKLEVKDRTAAVHVGLRRGILHID